MIALVETTGDMLFSHSVQPPALLNILKNKERYFTIGQIRIPIPAVDFKPPVYICRRATKPFQLDGNINKPFWEDAPFTDAFLDIEGSHMPVPVFLPGQNALG